MGKVRIIDSLGEGRYTVQRLYDDQRYQQRKAKLEAREAELTEQIDGELFLTLSDAESYVDAAKADYLAAVDDYIAAQKAGAGVSAARQAMLKAYEKLTHAQRELIPAKNAMAQAKFARREIQNDLAEITAWEDPAAEEAWCADFTTDASGDLASIEVPGEPQKPMIVYPQARGEGAFDRSTHGQLMPREWMTGPQAYLNAALLPGWQRFKPLWRLATIDALNGNAADVMLDEAVSTAASLPIDESRALSSVPIEYMDCNGEVFQAGDRVVVEFQGQDQNQPRVIGFESNPRQCQQLFVGIALGGGPDPLRVMMAKIDAKQQAVSERWFVDLGTGPDSESTMHSISGKPCMAISSSSFGVSEGRVCHEGTVMAPSVDVFYISKFGAGKLIAIDSDTQSKVTTLNPESLLQEDAFSPELIDRGCSYIYAVAGDGDRLAVAGYDGCAGQYFIKALDHKSWDNVAWATFSSAEYIEAICVGGGYLAALRWGEADGAAYLSLHSLDDLSLIDQVDITIFTLGVAISGSRLIVQREHWSSKAAADGGSSVYDIVTDGDGVVSLQWSFDIGPFDDWLATYDDGDRSASGMACG